MFIILLILSLISNFVTFALMCKDVSSNWIFFLTSLISTVVSWQLIVLNNRSKQNEEEIEKLKKQLPTEENTKKDGE